MWKKNEKRLQECGLQNAADSIDAPDDGKLSMTAFGNYTEKALRNVNKSSQWTKTLAPHAAIQVKKKG